VGAGPPQPLPRRTPGLPKHGSLASTLLFPSRTASRISSTHLTVPVLLACPCCVRPLPRQAAARAGASADQLQSMMGASPPRTSSSPPLTSSSPPLTSSSPHAYDFVPSPYQAEAAATSSTTDYAAGSGGQQAQQEPAAQQADEEEEEGGAPSSRRPRGPLFAHLRNRKAAPPSPLGDAATVSLNGSGPGVRAGGSAHFVFLRGAGRASISLGSGGPRGCSSPPPPPPSPPSPPSAP
jgi:hypothetical protein